MEDCLACAMDDVMAAGGGMAWNVAEFDELLKTVRDGLAETIEEVVARSAAILGALHDLAQLLTATAGERVADAVADVEAQLGQFIYPGFLAGVGADRLADIHRYVRAADYRIRRVAENADRDYTDMLLVRSLEDELDALIDALPWSQQMLEVTWMLQEFRVSLFAQPIGAKGPVSEKRLRRALTQLRDG